MNSTHNSLRFLPLSFAIKSALLAVSTIVITAPAAYAASAEQRHYQLSSGTLTEVLNAFAMQSDVLFSADAQVTNGLKSNGLTGKYTIEQGFRTILAPHNLDILPTPQGYKIIKKVATPVKDMGQLQQIDVNTTSTTPQDLNAIQLPAITVTADNSELSISNTSIMKGSHKLKEIPQSVSVMTREQIDEQNITDLRAAANNIPGVVGAKGVGQGMILSARGFQIDAWQYDGIPIPRNMYALGNWGTEGLVFYDRIEVLRGASGLLQGTGSPGGAVNLVRKRGQNKNTISLTSHAGSWDRYGLQLDAGAPLNEDGSLRGRMVIDGQQSHSFIDYVNNKTNSYYGSIDYDFSPNTTLGLGISYSDSEGRPMIRGLPRYSDGGDLNLARSTFSGALWNRANIEQTNIFGDLDHKFNDDWKFKFSILSLNEKNTSTHQRIQGGVASDGSGITYANWVTDFDSEKLGLDTYFTGKFNLLGIDNDITLGANYSKYTSNDMYARKFIVGGNVFEINNNTTWQNLDTIMAAGGVRTNATYDVQQKGIYGSWRAKIAEPLTAILGARLSWYEYIYNESLYNTQTVNKASAELTPYVGLVYELTPQWSAYGSYTSVFEPQSSRDTTGKVLDPIIGTNYEIGLKSELLDSRVNSSLAIFRYDHKNRAVNDIESGYLCDGWYCSKASGKVRSEGFEAEINGEVLPNVNLMAGYTYNSTKFLSDPANQGKIFSTWTPKNMFRLWSTYQLPEQWNKFTLGMGVTTQTHTYSYDRSFEVPGFTVWNMRLGYQASPEFNVALNVNNVFDKRYWIPGFAEQNGNNDYGDPLNFMITLKYIPKL